MQGVAPTPFSQVIILHAVPTGSGACRLETMVTNPIPLGKRVRFSSWEHPIFRQDRVIMESAERWTGEIGQGFERSVEADHSMLLTRRIIELARNGLWEEKRHSLPQRRVLRIRA